jgi:hypothetical protein
MPDAAGAAGALVRRAATPPRVIARDLASATPTSIVHVDRLGQTRSPRRLKALRATFRVAVTVGPVLHFYVLGAAAGVFGVLAAFATTWLGSVKLGALDEIDRGARLAAHDRLDEAAVAFTAALARRPLQPRVRAIAELALAWCRARQGDHEAARTLFLAVIARVQGNVHERIARYGLMITQINLGHTADARRQFVPRLAAVPRGDYLRLHHHTAELYLMLAEGELDLEPAELAARTRFALGLSSYAHLPALCAWAHHQRGDLDQARHLLREALSRPDVARISPTMPLLQRWIDDHADEARPAASAEG